MFLIFIILIIIAFLYKKYYELQKFNIHATVQQIQNPNSVVIKDKLKENNPIIIHNLANKYELFQNLSFTNLNLQNQGYIINDNNKFISLETFTKDNSNLHIHNNQQLIKDLNLENDLKDIFKYFKPNLSYDNYNLSLLKGNYSIELSQNNKNGLLIFQIYDKSTLYLIHPKHKEDILNKNNNSIKKWAHKINLEPNLIVHIPSQWYYFYECENSSIISTINYYTII
jgi:hypothetical protein